MQRVGRRVMMGLGLGLLGAAMATGQAAAGDAYAPGTRVLLDAHNAYPERGQHADRLDRALATGTPVAIEQDLHWGLAPDGTSAPVVAHDDDALEGAPTLRTHFFERIRPLMEQALRENRRETWPLLVLNLDFKDDHPAHLDAVWALLGEYEAWLTTTPRTDTPAQVAPLRTGPLLVLSGADRAQRRRFHDDVPIGATLRVFGAMEPAPVAGRTRAQRAQRAMRMTPVQHVPRPADNFARWVNFPWSVVEAGGQAYAQQWTRADSVRLTALVQRAHRQGYWIRFYTLDGFSADDDRGWTASYNFGSLAAVAPRWRAAVQAGVDFVATDQYEAFAAARRQFSP
jgi:glycerophosphoryl diester phosphodiesterase